MDLRKIGGFIAEKRKIAGLTQAQLAEMLFVTDKAVSKWENGRSLPDSSIMLDLCDALKITVNELLNGGEIDMKDDKQKNEQILLEMTKELEKKDKEIWNSMWTIMIVSMIALVAGSFAAALLIPEGKLQLAVVLGVCIVFLIPMLYALKLEIGVGAYKCKNCGHEIVPTYFQALNAMHLSTTRYLKCPNCNKRTWAKKVFTKTNDQ